MGRAAFFCVQALNNLPYSRYRNHSRYRASVVCCVQQGLEVVLLDVLEVAVGAHLELIDGSLVGNDDGMGMHLQGTQGAHLGDAALDSLLQSAGLGMAVDDDHHLAGIHHGADAHGECRLGHLVQVAVKEAAVGDDGVLGEGLLTRT